MLYTSSSTEGMLCAASVEPLLVSLLSSSATSLGAGAGVGIGVGIGAGEGAGAGEEGGSSGTGATRDENIALGCLLDLSSSRVLEGSIERYLMETAGIANGGECWGCG